MKIYVVELINGERNMFNSIYDRNAYLNGLDAKNTYLRMTAKVYEFMIG